MKFSLEGFKGRFGQAEERISKLEHRTMKIIEYEAKKEKSLKKSDQNLRDMRGTIKWANLLIVGVPEGEERQRKGQREYLKK